MTYTEVLPTLRTLNHKDKIRVIQFLANEVARGEDMFFENQEHEFISQTDAFEASRVLQNLIDEKKANAST
jgi:ATP:corrinoid adenosyltransferase